MAKKKGKGNGSGHANRAWKEKFKTADQERATLAAEVATLRAELEMADVQVCASKEVLTKHATALDVAVRDLSATILKGTTEAIEALEPFQEEIISIKAGKLPPAAERIEELAKGNRTLIRENRALVARAAEHEAKITSLSEEAATQLTDALDIRREGYLGTKLLSDVMRAIPEGTDLAGQQAFLGQLQASGAGWPKALGIVLRWFLKQQKKQAKAAQESLTIGDLVEAQPEVKPEVEPEGEAPAPEDEAQPEAAPEPAAEPENTTEEPKPEEGTASPVETP